MKVKICANKGIEDAKMSLEAGADIILSRKETCE